MSEITVLKGWIWDSEKGSETAVFIRNYPGPIGEAELYAIKTALEKQVQLNAEVERLRDMRAAREAVSTIC